MPPQPSATERFSDRARDYVRGRPGYPKALAALLGRAFELGDATVVVDVGCGTGLEAACADLLIAGQAFHWFDAAAARREALRILRRPAHAALVWNERRADGSALALGYSAMLEEFATDASIVHRATPQSLAAFFGAVTPREASLENPVVLDLPGLLARAASTSYLPAPGSAAHAAMCERLGQLFTATACDGRVVMEHDTRIYYATLDAD